MRGEDGLRDAVERAVAEGGLFAPGERIVAAVSGGPDSVALLHVLWSNAGRHGWAVAAAHVNHGLRGAESDAEEAYVRELCAKLGIPAFVRRVDVEAALPAHGNNVQAAARALRLEAFREAAAAWETRTVALGHHGDDQAETVLMRLLRGTGPGGLAGIRPISAVNGLKLVRPLLRITKADLEAYCARLGLAPRFDSSNASRDYFRNAVRLDALPLLERIRPGAAESLRRVAETAADEDDYLDAVARERIEACRAPSRDGTVRARRDAFVEAHPALQRRMIKIILSSLKLDKTPIDYAKIERIRTAIAADRPTTLELRIGARAAFRREYDRIEWAPIEERPAEPYRFEIDASRDGSLELETLAARLEWSVVDAALRGADGRVAPFDADERVALFDADEADRRWIVRSRLPGDRIEPYGLNGTKKVKDMFIDGKLPKRLRDGWPIVTAADGAVLWVPGFRRSRAAPVGPRTKRIVVARFAVLEDDGSAL